MDAFFAAVEMRDNPELLGKPLIIGALPHERGVVATCSYEARAFGVRSAMNIKEAYRLCPHGIYMHPSSGKYSAASKEISKIWDMYTDLIEKVSIDEAFLDVTQTLKQFGGAEKIAWEIKRRTKEEIGLTCSVGIGYSKTAAKLASEEKKPDGFFVIADADSLKNLIIDRSVRVIYGVGPKTADALAKVSIHTVRDLFDNRSAVINLMGNHGSHILDIAEGIDDRRVVPNDETEAKSISREITFQTDIDDFSHIKDAIRLLVKELSLKIRMEGLFARTVTIKAKYANMKQITRSKSGTPINRSGDIYKVADSLLNTIDRLPIRLIGVGLSGFTDTGYEQLTLEQLTASGANTEKKEKLDEALLALQKKFGADVIRTGNEMIAEQRFENKK